MGKAGSVPDVVKKQRRLRAPVRREHVLAAALELFSERGYRASMGEIARASGVTRTVLYYYFPTKKDLFLAVLEAQLTEFLRQVAPAAANPGTFEDRVRGTLEALLGFAESSPRAWDIVFMHRDEDIAEVAEVRAMTRQMIKVTAEALLSPSDMTRIGVDPRSAQGDLFFDVSLAAIVEAVAWWRRNPTVDRATVVNTLDDIFGRVAGGLEDAKTAD